MVKVCHLSSVHQANDIRIFKKECISLAKSGFQVHFVVPGNMDRIVENVHISHVKPIKARILRMTILTYRILKKAIELDAKIYHLHDPELLPVGWILKIKGKTVIYDAHEHLPKAILSKSYITPRLRGIASVFFDSMERYFSKKMDFVIAATDTICKRFQSFGVKSATVYNYPVQDELFSVHSKSKDKKAIIYNGGITQIRGILQVVRALEITKDVVLHLAGAFESDQFRSILEQEKGWKQVQYWGFVDRAELRKLMGDSMAGILCFLPVPNHIEALPNKLFEYMSAGLPVVASNFDLWKRIVEDKACGICVPPEDPGSIAEGILKFTNDRHLSETYGNRGRKLVIEEYNWEQEQSKLILIYQQLLDL